MTMNTEQAGCLDYCLPIRNRYFYGKLLDVFHFEMEQKYFNMKRWLLNRLVTGYGVVCGLDVLLTVDKKSIYVTPGVAIDKCGHEIIVCQPSCSVTLPVPPPPPAGGGSAPGGGTSGAPGPVVPPNPAPGTSWSAAGTGNGPTLSGMDTCGQYVHLVICYHECPTDPSPSMGGDCDTQAMCSPGAIRERYCLQLVDGQLAAARTTSAIADLFSGGTINYPALANYVTGISATDPCPDCCIPLANILIPDAGQTYDQTNIDITMRPCVYTLDMLYEMILAMKQGPTNVAARKP